MGAWRLAPGPPRGAAIGGSCGAGPAGGRVTSAAVALPRAPVDEARVDRQAREGLVLFVAR